MGIKERKEREKELRHDDIVNAAEKVFFSKGLPNATMDEIAAAAELSKGTLYLYFRSKEDLYLSVARRGEQLLNRLFSEAVARGGDPIQQLINLSEAYIGYFTNHRDYFRMSYFLETPGFHSQVSEEMLTEGMESDRRIWAIIIDVVRRGMDEGLLHKELDPVEASVMVGLNMYGFLRFMDTNNKYWTALLNVSMESMLRRSNALLLSSMMTKKGKKLHPELLVLPELERIEPPKQEEAPTDMSSAGQRR